MRTPLIVVVLGFAVVAGTIALNRYQRGLQREEMRGIAALQAVLDSTRWALAAATTAPESTQLTEQIRARTEGIAQRQYHVPRRQAELDRWWQPTGPGTILVVLGTGLVIGGLLWFRRSKSGAA
jgi:hypothetical protein